MQIGEWPLVGPYGWLYHFCDLEIAYNDQCDLFNKLFRGFYYLFILKIQCRGRRMECEKNRKLGHFIKKDKGQTDRQQDKENDGLPTLQDKKKVK